MWYKVDIYLFLCHGSVLVSPFSEISLAVFFLFESSDCLPLITNKITYQGKAEGKSQVLC